MRCTFFFAFASTTACASFQSTARDAFVREATCPADRVTVVQAAPDPAPARIAADPGRLALWNAEAAQRAESQFVARGCGQTIRYSCEKQYVGEGRDQTSFLVCASGTTYRASYSFSSVVVAPPASSARKLDVPLVIVLDPSRVRDRWKMRADERTFELTDFRAFVSRDLRAAFAEYFSDVRVVAPDAPDPVAPFVRADVNVDDVSMHERVTNGYSYAKLGMRWSLTMRASGATAAAFTYQGVAASTEAYPTFEAGCAQMVGSAESDLMQRFSERGGVAMFAPGG